MCKISKGISYKNFILNFYLKHSMYNFKHGILHGISDLVFVVNVIWISLQLYRAIASIWNKWEWGTMIMASNINSRSAWYLAKCRRSFRVKSIQNFKRPKKLCENDFKFKFQNLYCINNHRVWNITLWQCGLHNTTLQYTFQLGS